MKRQKGPFFFSFLFHGNSSCFADGFTHQVMHEKPYISNKNSVFHFSTDPTTATTILLYITYTIPYGTVYAVSSQKHTRYQSL